MTAEPSTPRWWTSPCWDDDADFRTYVEDFLNDEGMYAVRTFERPEMLYDAADERRPDIVLLDMKMGRHRGDAVLEHLLARYPGLCVIIVTGYPSLEDMRATFKLKVFDYLAKPFSLSQLRQTLANAIQQFGSAAARRTGCARSSATASASCAPSASGR